MARPLFEVFYQEKRVRVSRNPDFGPRSRVEIGGPFETTAHGYLSGIVGGTTPLSLDVRFGIRQAWEVGEPQFGITSNATDGYLCFSYVVHSDLTFSAQFNLAPGSAAPAWGTTAET